ncbi:hypothetical protein Tco_1183903 [Tanacetum coccineum]
MFNFSHQSLNGLSLNCLPLSETIPSGKPKQHTMLSTRTLIRSGYQQKAAKPSKMTITEHGMERLCKSRPKSKNAKVRVNTKESAVKPEPELKNTIGCNLYH